MSNVTASGTGEGAQHEVDFSYQQLDKVIHSRIRFAALCYLETVRQASFIEIREHIGATDGNLSVHMRKLEAAGYVYCDKTYKKRVPLSVYSMTSQGRSAFMVYKKSIHRFFSPFEQLQG
ncbi:MULTISPECIES: winged helix-turn-helix domain-containing protein [Prosthecochloris]|uniref:Transcriptional regulator n=1 Tax=Prosthecochloris vibrioformis TaxID=1098 RepID=A0A5C4S0I6_PROVB|nr:MULTISPECIES: transcriptional regulator [Prosthecochloris]ANT64969.1 hypothetical protein Ptc2401_01196 [Prosthecochloris sp. CIB 2401]TNJ36960.1 transcriptional regulator [Prosthecochloris vibrioformis]